MGQELLGSLKSVNSENKDINMVVELKQTSDSLLDSQFIHNLDLAERTETERLASDKFRLFGQIEYKSIIDGITKQPLTGTFDIDEIFTPELDLDPRTLLNSFDIYLCVKDDVLVPTPPIVNGVITDEYYQQNYKIISKIEDLNTEEAGYYVTEDDDKIWYLNFNKLYDIKNKKDFFNKPLTDFYLYFRYKTFNSETLLEKHFTYNYQSGLFNYVNIGGSTSPLPVDTILNGDIINFKKENYLEETITEQNYRISIPCSFSRFSTFHFYTDLNDLLTNITNASPNLKITISSIDFNGLESFPEGNRVYISCNGALPIGLFDAQYYSYGLLLPPPPRPKPLTNSDIKSDTYYFVNNSYYKSLFRSISVQDTGNNTYTLLFKNINDAVYNFDLILKYDPFVKIPLKKWSDYTENGTVKTDTIPEHAIKFDNDNYLWKDYELDKIFPFLNDCHYVYKSIYFTVVPDLTDTMTRSLFKNFDFSARLSLNKYNANNISFPDQC
jgi:hypothetical protein